ncbi:DnaD domain-containing protein [Oceanobacillus luteolus]|uniref:DnaD domain-containing protein n=1 Tax=Oceanobacillus luteolus TaxID=1274358 RepID=A0ABW4HXN8_9BACI
MNYIKQLNMFKQYLEHHELPSVAILLWHTLMLINNRTGWKKSFNAPQILIQQYSGLTKQRLSDARKVLVEHGLIRYAKGNKGRAPVYEMIILYDSFLFDKTDLSPDLSADLYEDESRNIPKLKHKQKSSSGGEQATQFYEENFSQLTPAVGNIIEKWCELFKEEVVLEAMRMTVMQGGKTLKYIEKILTAWSRAGLRTVKEVRVYEEEKESLRIETGTVRKQEHAGSKSLFDELREEMIV